VRIVEGAYFIAFNVRKLSGLTVIYHVRQFRQEESQLTGIVGNLYGIAGFKVRDRSVERQLNLELSGLHFYTSDTVH